MPGSTLRATSRRTWSGSSCRRRAAACWTWDAGTERLPDDFSRTTAANTSASAVRTAQSRGLDVRLIEDAAALPFPDSSFDSAISIEVLEHLWAPHHAAAEALRVLKPGGTYFATCPNVVYWRRRADMLLFGRWHPYGDELSVEQPWRDPHIRFFTPAAMRRMIERAGFVDVRVSGHDCELFGGVPGVRTVLGRLDNPRLTRWLASHAPSLFACRINVTARKRP